MNLLTRAGRLSARLSDHARLGAGGPAERGERSCTPYSGRPLALDDALDTRRRLCLLVTFVLIGTTAAIVFHYVMASYLAKPYPQNTFLFLPVVHFTDWSTTYHFAQGFLHGHESPFMYFVYFPFAFLLVCVATVLPWWLGFAVLVAAFLAMLVWLLDRFALPAAGSGLMKLQWGFVLMALSYPVLFVIDRGNLEMLVFVFVAAFVVLLQRGRCGWAGLFLAMAIAMKLYPATLLVLLLAERRFKAFAGTVLTTLLLTGASIALLAQWGGYGFADIVHRLGSQLQDYQNVMVGRNAGVQHGHSLWGMLVAPAMSATGAHPHWQLLAYSIVAVVLFVLASCYVVFYETEFWRRTLVLVVAWLLLPFVSADYTLIQLYIPLALFLARPSRGSRGVVYTVLFATLLIPLDYLFFASSPGTGLMHKDVSISVVIYPLALLGLVALAVWDRRHPATAVAGTALTDAAA